MTLWGFYIMVISFFSLLVRSIRNHRSSCCDSFSYKNYKCCYNRFWNECL